MLTCSTECCFGSTECWFGSTECWFGSTGLIVSTIFSQLVTCVFILRAHYYGSRHYISIVLLVKHSVWFDQMLVWFDQMLVWFDRLLVWFDRMLTCSTECCFGSTKCWFGKVRPNMKNNTNIHVVTKIILTMTKYTNKYKS